MLAPLSARWENWSDATRAHVETPTYPSYSESDIRVQIDDVACACPMCSGFSFSGPQAFTQPQSGGASNGLPIYNWNQAAAQIARDSSGWGAGAVVTYGFRASEPGAMPPGVSGFVPFNAEQIAVAINLWRSGPRWRTSRSCAFKMRAATQTTRRCCSRTTRRAPMALRRSPLSGIDQRRRARRRRLDQFLARQQQLELDRRRFRAAHDGTRDRPRNRARAPRQLRCARRHQSNLPGILRLLAETPACTR